MNNYYIIVTPQAEEQIREIEFGIRLYRAIHGICREDA